MKEEKRAETMTINCTIVVPTMEGRGSVVFFWTIFLGV